MKVKNTAVAMPVLMLGSNTRIMAPVGVEPRSHADSRREKSKRSIAAKIGKIA